MFFYFFRSVQQTIHFTGKLSHPAKTCSFRQTHVAGIITDPKPMNTQITSYMRNGLVEDARKLFDEMPHRNTVTWNSMIRGFFQNREFDYALHLFDQMPTRDLFTYNTMIAGLMQYGETDSAKKFFEQMPCKDVVSWNSMIAGFVNNSLMSEALECFEQMPVRNVISWNLVMSGMLNYGSFDIVERLFREMPNRDIASSTIMISGLVSTGRICEARGLFEEMPIKDVKAWNTMLIGYIENERIQIAEGLFFKMPERDTDSWNEMINGFVGSQRINDAVRLFSEMPEKSSRTWNSIFLGLIRNGFTEEAHGFFEKNPFNDIVSWTNMIIGYFELGKVDIAMKLFKSMPNKDQTAWNATIFGLGENDHGEEGLKLFMRMKEEGGAFPDEATFTSVLTISSILPSLDFGKQVHGQILKTGFDYITAVSNAIITMYARCGNMNSALLGFTNAPKRDVVSWNSIICGFAQHGNGIKALEMFKMMQEAGFKADQITFVGVLSACSHTGLIEHGKHYFNFMKFKCFIEPTCEHYTCMADLLGRFGFIEEAVCFIDQMKADRIEVGTSVWGALVGACRIHKNTRIGEIAAEKVLEIEPWNAGIYMILAEMYLSNGRRKDAERILVRMKENDVKKQPGCSWIEVNNSVNVFLAGDCSHPEFNRVCCVLELLNMEMESRNEGSPNCCNKF